MVGRPCGAQVAAPGPLLLSPWAAQACRSQTPEHVLRGGQRLQDLPLGLAEQETGAQDEPQHGDPVGQTE